MSKNNVALLSGLGTHGPLAPSLQYFIFASTYLRLSSLSFHPSARVRHDINAPTTGHETYEHMMLTLSSGITRSGEALAELVFLLVENYYSLTASTGLRVGWEYLEPFSSLCAAQISFSSILLAEWLVIKEEQSDQASLLCADMSTAVFLPHSVDVLGIMPGLTTDYLAAKDNRLRNWENNVVSGPASRSFVAELDHNTANKYMVASRCLMREVGSSCTDLLG